ncbi:MAG: DUF4390 domain-containing protein [Pseudomonadota bacterium]
MRVRASLALLALFLGAVLPARAAIEVAAIGLALAEEHADFSADVSVSLGRAVVDALEHGVPVTFGWTVELRDERDFAPDTLLWEASGTLRVDYRALSKRYSITAGDTDDTQSYPNRRRMLESLGAFTQRFPPLATVLSAGQRPMLRFRLRLEIGELPPALRLPSYLDPDWRLDSGWVERSLELP